MAEIRSVPGDDYITHIAITGRLDVEGIGAIELPLTVATVSKARPTIIDMSAVEFLGSLGIGVLVRCAVSLQRAGARMVLFGCQPFVRKTLETTRVTAVMPLANSEAEALALLTSN